MTDIGTILKIEDDPAILAYRCPQTALPLWPLTRNFFIRYLISRLVYVTPSTVPRVRSPWDRRRAVFSLPLSIANNLRGRTRDILARPIVIFASGQGLLPWQGRTINRLADHFALARAEQSVLCEGSVGDAPRIPTQRANPDVHYTLPFDTVKSLLPRLLPKAAQAHAAGLLVQYLCARARTLLDVDVPESVRAQMLRNLTIAAYQAVMIRRHFGGIFRRHRPRLILMEAGCYGHSAPLISAAREAGVPVAEYQHGMIGVGHHAYNFAPAMCESAEFLATLPDYFLSYGSWWTDRINAPVRKVVIGNPHRSEQIAAATTDPHSRRDLLIIGKPGDANRFIEFATALASQLDPGWRVVVRPHPRDGKALLERTGGRLGPIWIDSNEDLYTSLADARAVVGAPSTAMMEAIGIVDRILMWDVPNAHFLFPDHPFEMFRNAGDLAAALRQENHRKMPAEEVWASNWRDNYLEFSGRFL